MNRKMLRDDRWERLARLRPGKASDLGCTAKDNRRYIEAVLWFLRTGRPWRDTPAESGRWHQRMCALHASVAAACRGGRRKRWAVRPAWNSYSSIRRSVVPINTWLEPKTSGGLTDRPLARRAERQAACGCRCSGQSAARDLVARPIARYRTGRSADQGFAHLLRCRQQVIRFGCLCRGRQGAGRIGRDPATFPSKQSAFVRSASVPGSQCDRMLLSPFQAVLTNCHTLRQADQVVRVVHSSSMRFRMAGLIENRP